MLLIPFVDGIAKHLSETHSPLFISWARYAVAAVIVLPAAVLLRGAAALPRANLGPHILRTGFLVTAMTLYFLAIARIPLATAVSAYFIGPVIATLLGIVVLGEGFSARKLAALFLGFVGALLVLRPERQLDAGILLALGSGVFFALYLVATRRAALQDDPLKTLAFQCLLGAVLLAPQAIWTWSPPAFSEWHLFAALGGLSALSHILSIAAFRYAETSVLAPLVYLELLGTCAVGLVFFSELPELSVWIGAGIIVCAGLLLVRRPAQ
jgi:drug/metabolite transporter (DMT)-like permease